MRHKLIIDTDPGIDDLLAIALALASPEVEIQALTTIFGNLDTTTTTTNTLAILETFGRTDIPVARGADDPWVGTFNGGVPQIHGRHGLGDNPLMKPATATVEEDAADLIHRICNESPGEVTLFPIGPLTNIADAARRHPDLVGLVREVVIMGGNAYAPGNASPAAEANILQDPEAADEVFSLPWRIVMVGLDVTDRVTLSPSQIARVAAGDTPDRHLLAGAMAFYEKFYASAIPGFDGFCPHDATALSWLLRPDLFETVTAKVRVETEGISRGKTWPAMLRDRPALDPWRGRPDVVIPTSVDADAVSAFMEDRLVAYRPS